MKKCAVLTIAAVALVASAVPATAGETRAPNAVVIDGQSDLLIRVPRGTNAKLACVKNKTNTWVAGQGDCRPFASDDGHYEAAWRGRRVAEGRKLVVRIIGGNYRDGHTYTVRVKVTARNSSR